MSKTFRLRLRKRRCTKTFCLILKRIQPYSSSMEICLSIFFSCSHSFLDCLVYLTQSEKFFVGGREVEKSPFQTPLRFMEKATFISKARNIPDLVSVGQKF